MKSINAIWRYIGALAIVAGASLTAEVFSRLTGTSRLTSIFLSSVLLVAFYLGAGPAYLAAGAALLAHLYMVDPPYKFSLGSVDELNALLLFSAASVLICILAERVRSERAATSIRARANATLLAATRELSGTDDETFIRKRLAYWLYTLAAVPVIFKDQSGSWSYPPGELQQETLLLAKSAETPNGHDAGTHRHGSWLFRPLRAGGEHYGVAGWLDHHIDGEHKSAIELLVDTSAAAIARSRLAAAKTDAEARARTEDLRNALLSSVSHDLRTPLAAIMGAAGSLNRFADTFDLDTRRDLASTIEEEARRLDAFVSNLLQMMRLQSGSVSLKRIAFNLVETVDLALQRRLGANIRRIELRTDPYLPDAYGDPVLFEQAFLNVIDNALVYAGGATISVGISSVASNTLLVTVEDHGPGVPQQDLERIFEKFFRSAASQRVTGTGLGLAIARGLVDGMGGSARAFPTAGGGLTIEFVIPGAAT